MPSYRAWTQQVGDQWVAAYQHAQHAITTMRDATPVNPPQVPVPDQVARLVEALTEHLPSPTEIIEANFALTRRLLQAQRTLTLQLLNTGSPPPGPDTTPAEPAATDADQAPGRAPAAPDPANAAPAEPEPAEPEPAEPGPAEPGSAPAAAPLTTPVERDVRDAGREETPQARLVLDCLRASDRPLAKARILATSGLPPQAWTTVIEDLLARGVISREGRRAGTRYRLT